MHQQYQSQRLPGQDTSIEDAFKPLHPLWLKASCHGSAPDRERAKRSGGPRGCSKYQNADPVRQTAPHDQEALLGNLGDHATLAAPSKPSN